MAKEIIETSAGKLWVEDSPESGDTRVWWPCSAQVGEVAVDVLRGRARCRPASHGWYVLACYRGEFYEALQEL